MADRSDWAVRLIDQVTGPAKKMKGAIGALEEQFKRAGRSVRSKAADAFVSGIGKVKEGMLVAGAVAAGVGTSIVAATVKTADFAQTALLGFKAVAKHGASAEKLFAHSRQLAEDLGLDVQATSKHFLKFLALQFDPQMATNMIKMGADLRALGADAEGVDRIFSQLGQIQAKGKLQGEELVVLAENGLSTQLVYKHLAEQLGKTKDEILKMQQAGELTSDMAFPAILAAVMEKTGSSELGKAGKDVADKTLSGMAGKLMAQAQNLWIDIGREATPAIMQTFGELQTELKSVLGNPAVREGIVNTVETIAGLVRDAIPFVRQFIASFADGFGEAWPVIKDVLATLFDGFGSGATWMDTVRDFAGTLGKVVAFGVGVAATFAGMVAAGLQLTSNVVEGLIFLWNGLINGIGAAIFWVDDFFANLRAKWDAFDFGELATSIIDGLVNGIRNGITRVTGAVSELGTETLKSLKGVLGIASPSKEFAFLGEMSGEGFNQGLESSLDTAGPSFDSVTGGRAGAPDFGGDGVGAGRRGPLLVIESLVVHVGEQGGYQAGVQAARGLEDELGSIFERWTLEAAA
jgi:tape measure domain-containing protein